MMNKNRSFWLGMDRKFFLVEEDMPVLGDHDVLIKPMQRNHHRSRQKSQQSACRPARCNRTWNLLPPLCKLYKRTI